MVLQSQIPREGMGRRYVASSRKRRSRWPWLAGLAAIIVVFVIIFLPRGGPSDTNAANGAGDDPAGQSAGQSAAGVGQSDTNRLAADKPRPAPQEKATPPKRGQDDKPAAGGEGRVRDGAATFNPSQFVRQPPTGSSISPGGDTDLLRAPKTGDSGTLPAGSGLPDNANPLKPIRTTPREVDSHSGPAVGRGSSEVQTQFANAVQLQQNGRLLEARNLFNDLLLNRTRDLTLSEQQTIRDLIAELNDDLIFSPTPYSGDPLTAVHTVKSGDLLIKIAPQYKTTYQLIERINKINANRITVGQRLKIIKGPIHARVYKSQFRLDLFAAQDDGRWVYLTSFPVGLGEEGSTPIGPFKVVDKVENPAWTNRRTNEHFGRDDPKNPIGEHWIRLEGANDQTRGLQGYGIHGTIEPRSIGREESMGCIRMLKDDVHMVYDMLITSGSTVEILP